jgi:hypothetical protein
MSTIEELEQERDDRFDELNLAREAWQDAELRLEAARFEEYELQQAADRARRLLFSTFAGIVIAVVAINIWG